MSQVTSYKLQVTRTKGFTLLELLIVIAILAILATVVVLVLNPAETLKRTRDSQRLSDMNTLRAATALYVTQVDEPKLDNTVKSNTRCVEGAGQDTIWISLSKSTASTTDTSAGGGTFAFRQATTANMFKTDATGWVPVQYSVLKGGPPISNLPVDPTNAATNTAEITNLGLFYRYSCRSSLASNNSTTFEFNAAMESDEYKPAGANDKAAKDGGDNSNLYEVGTDLTILPASDTF